MENYENPQVDETLEEEEKNPLEGLLDIYEQSVQKGNELGFADIFKACTETIFKELASYCEDRLNLNFTPYDVNYNDGYFIFGRGSNSVVDFHVKEAPGWLFGIWWRPIKDENDETKYLTDKIRCEIFAQFEKTIDKFKPSASAWENTFIWDLNNKDTNWMVRWNVVPVVRMILTEPYIAWYKDMNYTDFNQEYVSREQAKAEYDEWEAEDKRRDEMEAINEKAMLDCIKYLFGPMIEKGDAYICNRGEGWYPRYNIILRNVEVEDLGCSEEDYPNGSFRFEELGWDSEEDLAYWNKTVDECQARADEIHAWWSNPVSNYVCICNNEKYYHIKEIDEKCGQILNG